MQMITYEISVSVLYSSLHSSLICLQLMDCRKPTSHMTEHTRFCSDISLTGGQRRSCRCFWYVSAALSPFSCLGAKKNIQNPFKPCNMTDLINANIVLMWTISRHCIIRHCCRQRMQARSKHWRYTECEMRNSIVLFWLDHPENMLNPCEQAYLSPHTSDLAFFSFEKSSE